MPARSKSRVLGSPRLGQKARICVRVCLAAPQGHPGRIPGTPILASQLFRPRTSVRRRNSAVASCFWRPSYRRSGCHCYSLFQVVARCCIALAPVRHLNSHCFVKYASMSVYLLRNCIVLWGPRLSGRLALSFLCLSRDAVTITSAFARSIDITEASFSP